MLNAEGYRVTSAPEHHKQALEAACALVGTGERLYDELDALRDVRNLKYTGARRTEGDLTVAKAALEQFANRTVGWLQQKHADVLRA